jgi:hypothetical protein
MYITAAFGWLLLIPLSTQPDAVPLAGFVRTALPVIWDQAVPIPFVLGALMFYVLLYQSRLVPRWLSIWGLVGAALSIAAALGTMFGLSSLGVLSLPIFLQEMVMAVWLIAKGFNPSALAPEYAVGTSGRATASAASGSAASDGTTVSRTRG